MSTESPELSTLRLGVAIGIAIITVLVYVETFPQNPPPESGGPVLFLLLNIPLVAIGGVILGIELSKLSPRLRHRLPVAILQLISVGIIMTPALVYGRVVRPRYFDLDVILLHYWFPTLVGAVLVLIQHGYGIVSEWRVSSA
jgi:hypothetical protein